MHVPYIKFTLWVNQTHMRPPLHTAGAPPWANRSGRMLAMKNPNYAFLSHQTYHRGIGNNIAQDQNNLECLHESRGLRGVVEDVGGADPFSKKSLIFSLPAPPPSFHLCFLKNARLLAFEKYPFPIASRAVRSSSPRLCSAVGLRRR